MLALGIVEGNNWGWASPAVLGCFAIAAVLLAAVVVRSRTHPRPLVDLELFRIRSFRIGTLGTMLFAAAFFSTILGNILFLTGVWGYSVLHAGLAVIPGPLASAILAGPAGKLADRYGHRAVIVPGTVLYGAGLAILMSAGTQPDYVGTWLPGMVIAGAGIGLAFPTLGAAAAAEIPAAPLRHRDRRHLSGPPARRRPRHRDPDRDRRRAGDAWPRRRASPTTPISSGSWRPSSPGWSPCDWCLSAGRAARP